LLDKAYRNFAATSLRAVLDLSQIAESVTNIVVLDVQRF
jgi:hypothetical protein